MLAVTFFVQVWRALEPVELDANGEPAQGWAGEEVYYNVTDAVNHARRLPGKVRVLQVTDSVVWEK